MSEKKEDQIKFLLLAYMCRKLWEQACKPLKEKYKLSPQEIHILKFLETAGNFNTAKNIAEFSCMKKGIISVYIEKMIIGGWITQKEDPDDRRSKRLSITEKAIPVVQEIKMVDENFHHLMMRGISNEEIAIANSVYEKIYANIKNISNEKFDEN